MKRSSPEQIAEWRARSKPLKRGNGLKRAEMKRTAAKRPRRKRPPKLTAVEQEQLIRETRAFKEAARRQVGCALCGKTGPWEAHHVLAKTFLSRERLPLWHPDNSIRLCPFPCHEQHTTAFKRLPLSVLKDYNIEYAVRLLGEDRAHDYLKRHYTGIDPRVEALIAGDHFIDLEDAA